MGKTIDGILPLALGVAISPVPIIAIILMLITPRARANGAGFVLGWVLGLAAAGGIVLTIANAAGVSASGGPSTAAYTIRLVLGIVLLLLAARQWRGCPRPGESAPQPRWMVAFDRWGATAIKGACTTGLTW